MSAKHTAIPFINTGLDDSKVILQYPKDPVQIGTIVKDGVSQPVWVDPKDFILTPEQKAQQAHAMKGASTESSMQKALWEIAAQADAWMGRCVQEQCPVADKGIVAIQEWLKSEDINYSEDNSTPGIFIFILRRGDKEMSRLTVKLVANMNN